MHRESLWKIQHPEMHKCEGWQVSATPQYRNTATRRFVIPQHCNAPIRYTATLQRADSLVLNMLSGVHTPPNLKIFQAILLPALPSSPPKKKADTVFASMPFAHVNPPHTPTPALYAEEIGTHTFGAIPVVGRWCSQRGCWCNLDLGLALALCSRIPTTLVYGFRRSLGVTEGLVHVLNLVYTAATR